MNLEACAKRAVMTAALLLLAFDASAQEQQRPPRDMGRPAQLAPGDAPAPHGWHMSREERRQLRRDVNEAGRDIYPEHRRARHREQTQTPPAKMSREPAPAQ